MSGRRGWVTAVSIWSIILFLGGCWARGGSDAAVARRDPDDKPTACTVFTVSQDDRVFFGGNSDGNSLDCNYYWVDPGGPGSYGAIYFGHPNNVQQGFNEKGLGYDANGLPSAPVSAHTGRAPTPGGYTSYPIEILRACATVDEVIAWVKGHRWHTTMHDQLHFADASGDAVVIGAGPDGRVAFARKPAGDGFLVSTNFNLADPTNGSYPCWRYNRAEALLSEVDSGGQLTAEGAASVLDAVHVDSPSGFTAMSVVGDLPQRLVYVYLLYQFDAPVVLNIAEEIARAPKPGPLRDLFPPETLRQVDRTYRGLMTRSARSDAAGLAWLGVVAASLIALLVWGKPHQGSRAVWMAVVATLGPVGLLVWRLVATPGRYRRESPEGTSETVPEPPAWRRVLVESIGDLPPYVLGLVVALLIVLSVAMSGETPPLLLLTLYGFPLGIGLFGYRAPLLTRGRCLRTALRRLPGTIVSTNIGLAGMLGSGLAMIQWHLNTYGLGSWTVLVWWAIIAVSSLAGGLLLYGYHAWEIRRGYTAWSALQWDAGAGGSTGNAPSWRRLWAWIVLSFAVLFTGALLGLLALRGPQA